MTTEFTIAIPTYGRLSLLGNAVVSCMNAAANTGKSYEVLIYNTDPRVKIVASGTGSSKIRVINADGERVKQAEARQTLLMEAQGRYFAPQDDDDVSYHNRLIVQHELLRKNPDCWVAHSMWYDTFHPDEKSGGVPYVWPKRGIHVHSGLYDRETLIERGGWTGCTDVRDDWDMWDKCVKNGDVAIIDDPNIRVYQYRWSGVNYHLSCSTRENIDLAALKENRRYAPNGVFNLSV